MAEGKLSEKCICPSGPEPRNLVLEPAGAGCRVWEVQKFCETILNIKVY